MPITSPAIAIGQAVHPHAQSQLYPTPMNPDHSPRFSPHSPQPRSPILNAQLATALPSSSLSSTAAHPSFALAEAALSSPSQHGRPLPSHPQHTYAAVAINPASSSAHPSHSPLPIPGRPSFPSPRAYPAHLSGAATPAKFSLATVVPPPSSSSPPAPSAGDAPPAAAAAATASSASASSTQPSASSASASPEDNGLFQRRQLVFNRISTRRKKLMYTEIADRKVATGAAVKPPPPATLPGPGPVPVPIPGPPLPSIQTPFSSVQDAWNRLHVYYVYDTALPTADRTERFLSEMEAHTQRVIEQIGRLEERYYDALRKREERPGPSVEIDLAMDLILLNEERRKRREEQERREREEEKEKKAQDGADGAMKVDSPVKAAAVKPRRRRPAGATPRKAKGAKVEKGDKEGKDSKAVGGAAEKGSKRPAVTAKEKKKARGRAGEKEGRKRKRSSDSDEEKEAEGSDADSDNREGSDASSSSSDSDSDSGSSSSSSGSGSGSDSSASGSGSGSGSGSAASSSSAEDSDASDGSGSRGGSAAKSGSDDSDGGSAKSDDD